MLSIPKTPTIQKTNYDNRKRIYTITKNNKFFTIKLNKDENDNDYVTTTLLAFTKRAEAVKIGHMLENHYNQTKDWPETLLNPNDGIYLMSNDIIEDKRLSQLYIKNWNYSKFNTYCIENLFDYLLITELKTTENKSYTIRGELVRIAENQELQCAEILNKIYNKS